MAPTRTTEREPPDGSEPKARRKPGRAPVSCAECRRLKLRCDRKVPCETCTKRGCAALCPNGSLPTTKGPKKSAADVQQLKKKVEQLEAALRKLQAAVSDEPHPLLADDGDSGAAQRATPHANQSSDESSKASGSTNGSSPPSSSDATSQSDDDGDVESDLTDAFGTLTMGTRGEARYFGQTSRSEYLIHAPERQAAYETPKLPRLTNITVDEANKELDVFCTSEHVLDEAVRCLPPIDLTMHLCEIFFAFSKFMWYPAPKQYIINELIPNIYYPTDAPYCHVTKKHGLAMMLMILALGTLFDLNMPPYAAEAHEYYLFARVCLRWAPPAFDTTLTSIQTLIYMSIYLELSDCEPAHTGSQKAWMQIRQAVSMGQSIGLHVNSSKWQLDPVAAAKRGRIFWQLFHYDTFFSFGLGRPPSINMAYVDCGIPTAEEAIVNDPDDRDSANFHVWVWQFAKLKQDIMAAAFGAKTPTYATIVELDRRVRDFPIPPELRLPCDNTKPGSPSVAESMQRVFVAMSMETTLLNLHRPYFSLAVKDASEDPLRHRYGPSVMAVYRSTWRILNAVHPTYLVAPVIVARCGFIWSHCLACAILLCLLITRAPKSSPAGPCLAELQKLCALFEEAATQSQVASNNLEVVRKLLKQAQAAMTSAHADGDAAAVATELDRLGGKTQLIHTANAEQWRMYCHWKLRRENNPGAVGADAYAGGGTEPRLFDPCALDGLARALRAGNGNVDGLVDRNGNVYPDRGPHAAGLSGVTAPPPPVGAEYLHRYPGGGVPVPPVGVTRAAPLNDGGGQVGDMPFNFAAGEFAGMSQADMSAMLDYDVAAAMLDPAVCGGPQAAGAYPSTEWLQPPNVGDAEATWQSLVAQLGI
ncbi:fungal-specific transcription factor domain-containing protein [Trametes elegans]|nr:fungal-specific transcription factor domain-containing protein [Trametes elegans]